MSLAVAKHLSLGSHVDLTHSYDHGGAWHTLVGAYFKGYVWYW